MDVRKLFSGIAVIIDNEVYKEDSPIYEIKTAIIKNNIPVVTFNNIPDREMVSSLRNVSFIILDWNFLDDPVSEHDMELKGLLGAETLKQEKQEELINFIKLLMEEIFVPIFIFSGVEIGEVEDVLIKNGLYDKTKVNRIFVKSKTDVKSEDLLFQCIEEWLKKMPSIYAMKEWENVLQITKKEMFKEWHQYAPQWVSVIWKMLKKDSNEVQDEFGEFLTRNLVNRIQKFHFEDELFILDGKVDKDELRKVIERERYIEYKGTQPEQAYTGDLFKDGDTYFLNIRAQCDLARKKDSVHLYLIKGKLLAIDDIMTEDICLDSEGELKFPGKTYKLDELQNICKNIAEGQEEMEGELQEINEQFKKYRNVAFFNQGEIIERKPEVILVCIDNGKVIKFRIDLVVKKFKELKDKRIGRVLPPYITRIQQKCSQYIVREGTLPIPREFFGVFEE